jgi:hypothetical protein
VLFGLAIGVMGVRAVGLLFRGARNAYRFSLIALIAGAVVGTIPLLASRMLLGGSMMVDISVYTTMLTLIVFLIIRHPSIWRGVDFEKGGLQGSGRGAVGGLWGRRR